MTTGIALTASGLVILIFGSVLSSNAYQHCTRELPEDHLGTPQQVEIGDDCREAQKVRGVAILGATVVTLGIGIPFIVYGAKKVPNAVQATLTPWVSPTAGGATLRLAL